ncbi:hypothetical protein H4219_002330 [Mycoemilia scoparia]|uniref:HIT domain-containing protein n=1 Tax=Mycoemilia scoparia TaxID=417184 RepID=A0A9W8A3L7_9FUNG|nr:hypothetical protein H4219_002330 [Mycoemilia scoparia]
MREFSRPKSCVFCNINNKDFKIVYQDTEFYGFHDRRPDAKAHILVIPKNHLGTVPELKPEDKPTGILHI